MTRSRVAATMVVAAALAGTSASRAADPPGPPGADAFSETALRGVRLAVGPRGAATDSGGVVHCVYGDTVLRRAWLDGPAWRTRTETLAPFPRVGPPAGVEAAIAFGAADVLHSVWFDPRRNALVHAATYDGSLIATAIAGDVHTERPRAAVAVDSTGAAHVAWTDGNGTTIRYAAEVLGTFGGFRTSVVATDAWGRYATAPTDVSLVVDAADRVHLGYTARSNSEPNLQPRAFVHATLDDDAWTFEVLDATAEPVTLDVGAAGSLAIGPEGTLHALYATAPDGTANTAVVRHAWRTADGWQREDVAPERADRAHLVADAAGALHAILVARNESFLLLRRETGWTVTPLGAAGSGAALAVSDGSPVVFTCDGGTLRAGRGEPTVPSDLFVVDRASEPILAPVVAVTADASPRIAIARDDADGSHVDVVRRDGLTWSVHRVGDVADVRVRPEIRVAGNGVTHVAWAAADGAIVCASDDGGTWKLVLATPPGAGADSVALALAPNGRRMVAFRAEAARAIRVAIEDAAGAWSVSELASEAVDGPSPPDLEIGADGVAHAVWQDRAGRLQHAARDAAGAGPWVTEFVADGFRRAPVLALDQSGEPWIAYVQYEFDFGSEIFASVARRTDEGWVSAYFGDRVPVALGFGADDVARAVVFDGSASGRTRDDGGNWVPQGLDAGPGTQRALVGRTAPVGEADVTVPFTVVTTNPDAWLRHRIVAVGGAIGADGGFHAAYIDRATGDLRYVTNRDPGRTAFPGVRAVPGDGTAHAPQDFEIGAANLAWADDDSGTRVVPVRIHADDQWEPDETVVIRLESASPFLEVGWPDEATVTILEPPHEIRTTGGAYFLPERIRRDPSGRVVIRATLQTGMADFDPRRPPRIRFGAHTIDVPYLARHRGAWRFESPDVSLSLRRVGASPSRWRCDLAFVPTPGEADPVGRLDVRFESGDFAAASVVHAGHDFALGTGPGQFESPGFHLVALRGSRTGFGSLALTAVPAGLSGHDDVPAPQHVTVTVDGVALADAVQSDFRRRGRRFVARTPYTRLEIDTARGTVRARISGTNLPSAARDGVVRLTLALRLGQATSTVTTRVVLHDGRLRW